jgi:hypothetical protein
VLPAGTPLWRVHRGDTRPHEFEPPRLVDGVGGGRFDGVGPGGHSCLYGSFSARTALAERFVRDLDFAVTSTRRLPRSSLTAESISVVSTVRDVDLVRLTTGPDLFEVGQSAELLSARGPDLVMTRRWATWLRENVDWAQGIVWQSDVDLPSWTVVLFEDACGPDPLHPVAGTTERLAAPDREGWLGVELAPFGVTVEPAPAIEKVKVFVNYRRKDGGLAATMLYEELVRRFGETKVFLDRRSMKPGTAFRPTLIENARSCERLAVVVGPDWEDARYPDGRRCLDDPDDWVRREAREAAKFGVRVVVVLVGTRPRLVDADLPEDVRFLAGTQYVHLADGFGPKHVALLVDELLT